MQLKMFYMINKLYSLIVLMEYFRFDFVYYSNSIRIILRLIYIQKKKKRKTLNYKRRYQFFQLEIKDFKINSVFLPFIHKSTYISDCSYKAQRVFKTTLICKYLR